MNRVTPLQSNDTAAEGVLYMAMELGDKRWKLVFSDWGAKRRHETVEAGRRAAAEHVEREAKWRGGGWRACHATWRVSEIPSLARELARMRYAP